MTFNARPAHTGTIRQDPHSMLDDLEEHVRRLEQRTHELEQTLDEEVHTVLEEPVRFSLTNLRSKVDLLERHQEESGRTVAPSRIRIRGPAPADNSGRR